jgi:HEPN domain-containing protein
MRKIRLSWRKEPIPKIHDLRTLNGIVVEIKDFGFEFEMLSKLTNIYTESRYGAPGMTADGSLPSLSEAREYLAFARSVAVAIQAAMGENGQALPLAQRSAI